MLESLERHPNALAVLGPALKPEGRPSHAYLFHGPGGAGKRTLAREVAATLLAHGAPDPASAQARALAGAHPDLTWVVPSGAHEILVSDIDQPVVAAASRTPFESARRVFVIEGAEQLGDEAANRLLKTLEEPASFVHLILITDRLADVLPTIRSRCQVVRFDAPAVEELAAELSAAGVAAEVAQAYARLSLGDAGRARALAEPEGVELRERAQELVRRALAGEAGAAAPWDGLLAAVRARGERVRVELEERQAPSSSCFPVAIASAQRRSGGSGPSAPAGASRPGPWSWRSIWSRRGCSISSHWRSGRSIWSGTVTGWASCGRTRRLVVAPMRGLCAARSSLVEDTRQGFMLNVSEDLALEALTYRLGQVLAG